MNSEEIKKLIDIAKSAVKDEKDPVLKTEAFKVVLEQLLKSKSYTMPEIKTTSKPIDNASASDIDLQSRLKVFSEKCGLTVEELNDVFSIKNNSVEIICPINGSEAQKHLTVSLSVLAAFEFVLGYEWVPSITLGECLRSAGVKDLANFSTTMKKHSQYFRTRGSTKSKEYKLTSTDGRKAAFETIFRLHNADNKLGEQLK